MAADPKRAPEAFVSLACERILENQADRQARMKLSADLELLTRDINDANATLRKPHPLRVVDEEHYRAERARQIGNAQDTIRRLTKLRQDLEARLTVKFPVDDGVVYERACPGCGTDLLYEVIHPPIPMVIRRWYDADGDMERTLFFCPECDESLVA